MYNPLSVKRQKFGIGSLIFFIIFGAMFTAGGLAALNGTKIDESWIKTSGQVVNVTSHISDSSTMYTPVIGYTVEGNTYRITDSVSTSSYPSMGSTREVAYNPVNPAEAKAVNSGFTNAFILLFPAIGLLFIFLGPFLFVKSLIRSNKINKLIKDNNKTQGVLVDIQTTSSRNNNTDYKIVVAAKNTTGTVTNYVSDTLSGIGALAMADFHNKPIPIDVYIDVTNPQNYYVDVSEIPGLTVDRINELLSTFKNQPQGPLNSTISTQN